MLRGKLTGGAGPMNRLMCLKLILVALAASALGMNAEASPAAANWPTMQLQCKGRIYKEISLLQNGRSSESNRSVDLILNIHSNGGLLILDTTGDDAEFYVISNSISEYRSLDKTDSNSIDIFTTYHSPSPPFDSETRLFLNRNTGTLNVTRHMLFSKGLVTERLNAQCEKLSGTKPKF